MLVGAVFELALVSDASRRNVANTFSGLSISLRGEYLDLAILTQARGKNSWQSDSSFSRRKKVGLHRTLGSKLHKPSGQFIQLAHIIVDIFVTGFGIPL